MSVIDGILKDKEDIKRQLGGAPQTLIAPKRFTNSVRSKNVVTKQVSKSVAGSMIWGSESFGRWGDAKWGSNAGSSFILNSQSFGVLGTNKLGASGTQEALWAVIPHNDEYVEYFSQDMFIDDSSTGTLDTVNEQYTLLAGQTLQSDVIYKLRQPITTAEIRTHDDIEDDTEETMLLGSLSLGVSTFSDDNVECYLSNDSGVTWHEVNPGEKFTFPTTDSTDELKYKLVSQFDVVLTKPLKIKVNH